MSVFSCASAIKGVKEHELVFLRTSRKGKTSWFYADPKTFFQEAVNAEIQLVEFLGKAPADVRIAPDIRSLSSVGLPGMPELFNFIMLLKRLNAGPDALGRDMAPFRVTARSAKESVLLESTGMYFPGAKWFVMNKIWFTNPAGDSELERVLLDWCGLDRTVCPHLKKMSFINGEIFLTFDPNTNIDLFRETSSMAKAAGRKPRVNENRRKISIKSAEGLPMLIHKRGEAPGLIVQR